MSRPFLLLAGDQYYPQDGTGDWKNCFETYELALQYIPEGVGWYEIVDLRDWTE